MSDEVLHRTWDGLHIAADNPTGSTVVVRRRTAAGELEFLLLHRNAKGPEYEGDWAWTAPAGCRQPGEPVYPAALRELAEEAGLTGLRPWAVDLSCQLPSTTQWVVFAVDVPRDVRIDLVDPEHDRYAWLPAAEARQRVRPEFVAAAQVDRVEHIPSVEISFRRMTRDDLPDIVRWQRAPHVRTWWLNAVSTPAAASERYGPRIDGAVPIRMWVVCVDGRAVGYVQDYPLKADDEYAAKTGHPDAIGFDYLIGEHDLIGRGLGTRVIWEYLRDVLVPDYPDAPTFLASPDHRNTASLRALAKCGFTQGRQIDMPSTDAGRSVTEVGCTLDRRHWFG